MKLLNYTEDESTQRKIMTQLLNEGDSYYQCAVPKRAVASRDCHKKEQRSVFMECSIRNPTDQGSSRFNTSTL